MKRIGGIIRTAGRATAWLALLVGVVGLSAQAYDDKPGDIFRQPPATAPTPAPTTAPAPGMTPAARDSASDATVAARDERVWPQLWRRYAQFYLLFEGDYHPTLTYDAVYPSSRKVTVDRFLEQQTAQIKEAYGINMARTRTVAPPREDVEPYVKSIPNLTPGSYGHLYSCQVDKILGPDQMLVSNVWLVDAERVNALFEEDYARARRATTDDELARRASQDRYEFRLKLVTQQRASDFSQGLRLVGFDTRTVTVGQRWRGPVGEGISVFVVKIGQDQAPSADSTAAARTDSRRWRTNRRVPVAIPLPAPGISSGVTSGGLGKPLTEEQFRDLLTRRHKTVTQFVDLVFAETKKSVHDVEPRVMAALEVHETGTGEPVGGVRPKAVEPHRP